MMKVSRMGLRPAARTLGVVWACVAAATLLAGRPAAARADPKPEVSPEERLKIEQALPAKAPAAPKKPRKLLVFTLNVGYGDGHRSIPHASLAFTLMGKKTGAFETVVSRDPEIFRPQSLGQFDAVFLNNTVGNLFTDAELRRSLLEFVTGGGGLLGVHGTAVAFTRWDQGGREDWREFALMLGARGANHRISTERVFIKLDDPEHPVNRAFGGEGFDFRDEFFRFQEVYSRDRVRVLLSIDTAKTDMRQGRSFGKVDRPDNDYALAWVRSQGKGRVFYSTIGHNPYVFWDKRMLEFYLAAIQFALGDLEAPTAPSSAAPRGDAPGGRPEATAAEPAKAEQPRLRYAVPAPGPLVNRFGANVQRTMALLASSTPRHRRHVRVLVYGQSISEGVWWRHVERDLRTRFPDADLEMVNRALGGHASNFLVREAETDVYPFYPDLVIFHVYGAHTCYEQIISRIRSRTAAEVLITTDHLGASEVPDARGEFHEDRWTKFMASFIPQVARRYGCELVDVREPWKRYVLDNKIAAKDLLVDGIHLGQQGNLLYAALVGRQLVYRPELKAGPDAARTYEVGSDVRWKDGKLVLEFEGNRIDAIAGPGEESASAATVLIDGRKPSEFRQCYAFTRAYGPGLKILCVSSEQTPLVEDWTIRVTGVDQARKSFSFEAIGSKTGPDGAGTSDKRFVSNSARIVIETKVEKPAMGFESDWSCDIKQVQPGAEVKFRCYALHCDRYVAPAAKDPSLESSVTLAQGIANGKHTLLLTAGDPPPGRLRALGAYRPPVTAPTAMVYDAVRPAK